MEQVFVGLVIYVSLYALAHMIIRAYFRAKLNYTRALMMSPESVKQRR